MVYVLHVTAPLKLCPWDHKCQIFYKTLRQFLCHFLQSLLTRSFFRHLTVAELPRQQSGPERQKQTYQDNIFVSRSFYPPL